MMGRGDSAAAEQQASSTAPLLEKTSSAAAEESEAASAPAEAGGGYYYYYVDGCPGCAVERHKAANPGIPYANFIYVWIVTLCTGTPSHRPVYSPAAAAAASGGLACPSILFPPTQLPPVVEAASELRRAMHPHRTPRRME